MAEPLEVIGGVDTHTDLHQAAVIDNLGRHLAPNSPGPCAPTTSP